MAHKIDIEKLRRVVEYEGVKGVLEALAELCGIIAEEINATYPGKQFDWVDAKNKIEDELIPYILV